MTLNQRYLGKTVNEENTETGLYKRVQRASRAARQTGESIATVVKELGLGDQTLRNWIKATGEGKFKGTGSKVVTPEAMELSRLRAEIARLKRENEIIKKRQQRTSREMFCEVRLDGWQQQGLCADRHVYRS